MAETHAGAEAETENEVDAKAGPRLGPRLRQRPRLRLQARPRQRFLVGLCLPSLHSSARFERHLSSCPKTEVASEEIQTDRVYLVRSTLLRLFLGPPFGMKT